MPNTYGEIEVRAMTKGIEYSLDCTNNKWQQIIGDELMAAIDYNSLCVLYFECSLYAACVYYTMYILPNLEKSGQVGKYKIV